MSFTISIKSDSLRVITYFNLIIFKSFLVLPINTNCIFLKKGEFDIFFKIILLSLKENNIIVFIWGVINVFI